MWGSHLIPLMCLGPDLLWRCQLGRAATCWLLQLLIIVCVVLSCLFKCSFCTWGWAAPHVGLPKGGAAA